MLIDFFAGLSFYIIPYLTGRFFTKKIFQAWVIGAFWWFILYFTIHAILGILKINSFSLVIRDLAVGISILSIFNIGYSCLRKGLKIDFKKLPIGVFLLGFTSVIYFLVWNRNTPYPLELNWDIYEHITLADLISQGKLSFFTSQISDTFTFNSYSPLFGILLSLPKIMFQRNLLGIYWWLGYWHYFLTALASYLIAQRVFRDRFLAIMAVIVSSLVFESVEVYTSLFLIPQTLVALITILVALEVKEYKKISLLITALVIFLMHYIVGPLCLLVLAVLYLAPRLPITLNFLNRMIILGALAFIASLGLNFVGRWSTLAIEEASHFDFSLAKKAGFVLDWYGFFLIFVLIGFLNILKNRNFFQKIVLILALFVSAVSFAPFSYFLKFYVLGHYLTNLIIVAGIGALVADFSFLSRTFSALWLTAVLLIVFYKNQIVYKEPLHFGNYVTQISKEEINASDWLASYNKGNSFLVSDPSTQYILEAVSGVNSQGGVYMNLRTRKTLEAINESYNSGLIKEKLLSIKDVIASDNAVGRKVLFAVGGRYFAWQRLPAYQKESTFYNIWSPRAISHNDKAYVNFLKNSQGFRLLYENSQIAIFKVL
ncbi:MAG: hypothetical protein M1289_03170 [Patescibacteria group bacterium]|nr:hypothetical protein [Patescibacteria group bacterium]